MAQAFVIMQIGNKELDEVYKKAIIPAIEGCGLEPKRVDKHNEGGLLKSEIISFIQESEIIIADITNERPNCYLEIGFAMGIDKFKSLILTVKDDHFPDHPNYKKRGPKIHFDLAGYDILSWSPDNIEKFKSELENRISRRLVIIPPSSETIESVWDQEWIESNRKNSSQALEKSNFKAFMEIRFAIAPPKIIKTQRELDKAARSSEIRQSPWPIGIYLYNVDEAKPHPTTKGIVAENCKGSYDYWSIKKSGDFYSLISLAEDRDYEPNYVFYDYRIRRVAEALLYCARLYSFLGVDTSKKVFFAIRHSGLKNRVMHASKTLRIIRKEHKSIENEIDTHAEFTISQIESDLVQLVKKLTEPLFTIFDFFQVTDYEYEDIINKFVRGQS